MLRRVSCASAPKGVTTADFFELVLECSGKFITSEALEPYFAGVSVRLW